MQNHLMQLILMRLKTPFNLERQLSMALFEVPVFPAVCEDRCEERAAVFIAFCRAVGIPARLVWVPSHNWAEFFLVDNDGKGQWILRLEAKN